MWKKLRTSVVFDIIDPRNQLSLASYVERDLSDIAFGFRKNRKISIVSSSDGKKQMMIKIIQVFQSQEQKENL